MLLFRFFACVDYWKRRLDLYLIYGWEVALAEHGEGGSKSRGFYRMECWLRFDAGRLRVWIGDGHARFVFAKPQPFLIILEILQDIYIRSRRDPTAVRFQRRSDLRQSVFLLKLLYDSPSTPDDTFTCHTSASIGKEYILGSSHVQSAMSSYPFWAFACLLLYQANTRSISQHHADR